jgi:NTP pyrophosphatase (non-canonical NTP hydrolase)
MDYSFKAYQQQSAVTATFGDKTPTEQLAYITLGLGGETGEVLEKIKKVIRGDKEDTPAEWTTGLMMDLKKELGDVLWYLARLCDYYHLDMGDVAESNLAKLLDRQQRGVLKGSGDNR